MIVADSVICGERVEGRLLVVIRFEVVFNGPVVSETSRVEFL